MACVLATPGSVPLLAETHAGSLLTCWLGFCQVGLEPFPVLTHWATTTNFMGLLPLPRFRAYLGATSAWFGAGRDRNAGLSPQRYTASLLFSYVLLHGPSQETIEGRKAPCGSL